MIKKNKIAVSLMLSYVFLIIIGLSLSAGVYAWWKKHANIEEIPKCPEEASLVLQDYPCNNAEKSITVIVENKGLFNIDGYDISGADDATKEPIAPLKDKGTVGSETGRYFFGVTGKTPLKPNNVDSNVFSYDVAGISTNLKKISIIPFIVKEEYVILCTDAGITQEVHC